MLDLASFLSSFFFATLLGSGPGILCEPGYGVALLSRRRRPGSQPQRATISSVTEDFILAESARRTLAWVLPSRFEAFWRVSGWRGRPAVDVWPVCLAQGPVFFPLAHTGVAFVLTGPHVISATHKDLIFPTNK